MRNDRQIMELWDAAYVKRWHTENIVGEQTVGSHSFGVVLLLLLLHPEPTQTLLRAAAFHDLAEKWTGDLPTQLKWSHPELRAEHDRVEEACEKHKDIYMDDALTQIEKNWLKACDMLDAYMFATRQLNMGNTMLTDVLSRIDEAMRGMHNEKRCPMEVSRFFVFYRGRKL